MSILLSLSSSDEFLTERSSLDENYRPGQRVITARHTDHRGQPLPNLPSEYFENFRVDPVLLGLLVLRLNVCRMDHHW
ncbi:hypothetical protein JD844_004626 [Phrynosoma platyrhinos]|uniref:Uncharacterized protein n=1 Tax=Phrynosoma platyrhinos TaxID=52577 RepID=A0ABQ7SDM5_PHRPL|nr:hypothetical protein JD844_004626 [Phrynosoma platyrhinos]